MKRRIVANRNAKAVLKEWKVDDYQRKCYCFNMEGKETWGDLKLSGRVKILHARKGPEVPIREADEAEEVG
jgi:hypothetical protein